MMNDCGGMIIVVFVLAKVIFGVDHEKKPFDHVNLVK
jgi:hypothetical protein